MCLKLSHLLLYLCYIGAVAVYSDVSLLNHVTNDRLQVPKAHQVISLLASLVESMDALVAQLVHFLYV